jgi:hypothetical protein
MKSILDRSFQYTPSTRTDVRKTFARIREQLAARQAMERTMSGATYRVPVTQTHAEPSR